MFSMEKNGECTLVTVTFHIINRIIEEKNNNHLKINSYTITLSYRLRNSLYLR